MWKTVILSLVVLLLVSCKGKGDFLGHSAGGDDISLIRYDRLQNEFVNYHSFSAWQKMNSTYSPITQLLVEDILALGDMYEDDISKKILNFFSDTTLLRLIADVEVEFADVGGIEKELNRAFDALKKDVPDLRVPKFYTQISALNESVVINDTLVGISLDKYMGAGYPLYSRFYYGYQSRSMTRERIVPDCLFFYLLGEYPIAEESVRNLLNLIIYHGKIFYIVQQLLGYSSPGEAIGYTEEEQSWCRHNKKRVWQFITQNRHLYMTDPMVIRRYVRQAPFTVYFGEESPAMVGTWIGAEIVSSYMKNNKDVSLSALLKTDDYTLILNQSQFKL